MTREIERMDERMMLDDYSDDMNVLHQQLLQSQARIVDLEAENRKLRAAVVNFVNVDKQRMAAQAAMTMMEFRQFQKAMSELYALAEVTK